MDYHTGGDRERWRSPLSFLVMMGAAGCGISTLLRLPWVAAYHGGSFFWLYAVAVVVVGWPMMLFELGLGQVKQNGAKDAFKKLEPHASGIGIGAGWLALASAWCYSAVLSYACLYFWEALFTPLPWTIDDGFFERNGVPAVGLEVEMYHFTHSVSESGSSEVSYQIIACLVAVWLGLFFLSLEGTTASMHVVLCACLFGFVSQMWLLLYTVVNLDGAVDGMVEFLKPTRNLDLEIFLDAITQAIFSCNVGCAVLVGFGSFNERSRDIVKHSKHVVMAVLGASLITGLAVFGSLGHVLSKTQHNTIPDLIRNGTPGYAVTFEALAAATATMGDTTGNYLAVALFMSPMLLGLISLHAWALALFGMLRDLFTNTPSWALASVACTGAFLGSLAFAFGSIGYKMLTELDLFLVRGAIPLAVFCQCVVGCFWRGKPRDSAARLLEKKINDNEKQAVPFFWRWGLKVSGALALVGAVGGIAKNFESTDSLSHAIPASLVVVFYLALAVGTPLTQLHLKVKVPMDPAVWSDRELTLHNPSNTTTDIHIPAS